MAEILKASGARDQRTVRRMHRRSRRGGTAFIIGMLILAVGAPANADVSPPSVGAEHALVGDPLFGMKSVPGTLFAVKPDEPTAMGSKTKVMTLHLAVIALAEGVVSEDDDVTISEAAANTGGSQMADTTMPNGVSLATGEIVKFKHLLRGLMYTTARSLARLWDHAYNAHAYFRQLVRFKGTYSATTVKPGGGAKTYSMPWGSDYPGWEGGKGGNTPNCDGSNKGCLVVSATRIGRRLVMAEMQGDPWNDDKTLFDYGFAKLFNPTKRAASAAIGPVSDHAVACSGNTRTVSAVIAGDGSVNLIPSTVDIWSGKISSSSPQLPASQFSSADRDVRIVRLSDSMYVVAHRVGGRIDVQLWSVPSSGAPALLTSTKASGTSVSLHPISSGIFAMAVTDANGRITVTTWRAISFMGGHWFQAVDSETDADVGPMRVALTRVQTNFPQASYLVAVSAQPGATRALAYAVDPSTGELTATDAAKFGWMITMATVSPAPVAATESELSAPAYVAIAGKDSGGAQKLNYIKINGQPS